MYFSTPLKLYIFKGIENRVVYVRQTIQCAQLRQDSGQKWTQHEVPLQGGPCIFNLFLLLWAGRKRKERNDFTHLSTICIIMYLLYWSVYTEPGYNYHTILYDTILYYTTNYLYCTGSSCLSIYLSIILSIYLSVHLSIYRLSVYLSFFSFFLPFFFHFFLSTFIELSYLTQPNQT